MDNKKKKSKPELTLIIAFLSIVIFLTAFNADRFYWMMRADLPGITPNNAIWRTGSWNTYFTEYFRFKDELVNLYGIFNLGLGKQSLDNFGFVKDNDGIMQKTQENFDRQKAIESIVTISDGFNDRDIPLIFVSQPPRFTEMSFPISKEIHFFGERDADFLRILTEYGVDVLEANSEGNVALKTDMHLTTVAEFDVARQIANRLEEMGIDYRDSDTIFDLANYDSVAYPFYGNLVKSSGEYFTSGADSFEFLYPRFDTDFTLDNPEAGIEKRGDFRNSLMNGMEETFEYAVNPYWVLNYLSYPSAKYTITNHKNEDGCKLLFIMDSVALRSISYLALGAGEITVIDPRGANGTVVLHDEVMNGNYDAVIVEGGGEEFFLSIDFSGYDSSN